MTESSERKVAGLLLAAGGSSRLGRPKQLVEFEGKTLIRRAAEALIDAGCAPVIVVLGAELDGSTKALDGLAAEIVVNEDWANGMGSSIACGMRAVESHTSKPDALLLSLCDQPHVNAAHLRKFIDTFATTRSDVISAYYDDVAGVPALFSSSLFPSLCSLKGEKGAREIIRNSPDAVTIPLPEAAIDVDTDKDLDLFS
jgi:molybdenum cofactor cytidylyltransferase